MNKFRPTVCALPSPGRLSPNAGRAAASDPRSICDTPALLHSLLVPLESGPQTPIRKASGLSLSHQLALGTEE